MWKKFEARQYVCGDLFLGIKRKTDISGERLREGKIEWKTDISGDREKARERETDRGCETKERKKKEGWK